MGMFNDDDEEFQLHVRGTRQPTNREKDLLTSLASAMASGKLFIGDGIDPKTGEKSTVLCAMLDADEHHIVTKIVAVIPSHEALARLHPEGALNSKAMNHDEARQELARLSADKALRDTGDRTGLKLVGGKDSKLH